MSSATSSSQNEDAGSNGIPRTINTAGVTSNSRNTSFYGGIAGAGHGDNTSSSFSLSSSGYSTYDNNGSLLRLSSNRNNYNNSANMILQEMTVNKLQFDKLHCLYGRSEHLKELNHVVSKLMSNKTQKEEEVELCEHPQRRQLVLLQGEAGSGKSTLARSVLRKLDQQDASLCIGKGKFDVILKDEPYSGIGEACRELVRNLLAQVEETRGESHPEGEEEDGDNDYNDAASARRRSSNCANVSATANKIVEDLRIALGHDAVLLYSLIPNLRLLLDGSTTLNAAAAVATSGGATAVVTTAATPHDDDPRTTTTSNANEGYTEAKARFQHVFRRFIRALSSPPSPSSGNNGGDNDDANDKDDDTHSGDRKLIFILDDIHWADAYSLELLESILTDSENKSGALLVIATFRSEQVSHELDQSLQRIQSSLQGLCGLTTIALENWQIPDLTAMLADLLNESRPETVLPLADCVHRKTHGNIFFSIQFLRTLFETGKLTYQFGLCKWTWDDPTNILQQMSSTENVIQLLTEKLKVLPNGIYTLLPAIACIGAQFRGVIVEFIVAHWNEFFGHKSSLNKKDETNATSDYTDEEPDKCLTNAKTIYNSQEVVNTLVDSGLIVVVGKDQYRWEHDKVQEAALSLLEPFELAELQYIIGDILLDKLTKSQLEEMLFVVSDLLDQHPNLAELPKKKRKRIRELNLDAGRKARESSAFHAASVYLRRGIKLLDADCWVTDYDLALHVYSASAEANYCAGNVEEMKQDCNAVLENATGSLVVKRRVYDCLLYSTLALDAVQDTQNLCLDLLARLGCTFPKRFRTFHLLSGALRINSSVDKTLEKVGSLKKIKKVEHQWIVCLLDTLSICAYHNDDDTFLPLVLIESLRSMLRYGLSDKGPVVLVAVGLLLVSLGNLKGAKAYSDKAMELLNEYPGCATRTVFLANEFVLHWQMPFETCLKPLLDTVHISLKRGDLDSACWSAYCYVEMEIHGGRSLKSVVEDCKELCARVADVKQLKILNNMKLSWQLARCLQQPDTAKDLFLSDGGVVTYNELRRWIDDNNDENLRQQLIRNRMHAKFWLGDYEGMAKMIKENKTDEGAVEKYHPAAFVIPPLYLQCAVCCFTLFRRTRQKTFKKSGMWFATKIHAWAKKRNPNVIFAAALLDAEIMSLVGSLSKASEVACKKKYESAIFMAARRGCFHDHSLAQELLGAFWLRQGDVEAACYHTQRAIQIYDEWGATRLASLLRVKHESNSGGMSFLLPHQQQELPERTIGTLTCDESDP